MDILCLFVDYQMHIGGVHASRPLIPKAIHNPLVL